MHNKLIITVLVLLYNSLGFSQATSEDQNYILKGTYKFPVSTATEFTSKDKEITYYDGLGRPKQHILYAQGGNVEHIITPIEYNDFGQAVKQYLPYAEAANSLYLRSGALNDVKTFNNTKYPDDLNAATSNPFSQTIYDGSPLNRPVRSGAPGKDWDVATGHPIQFKYLLNKTTDGVKIFRVTHPLSDKEQTALIYDGIYPANMLYKNVVKDENFQNTYHVEWDYHDFIISSATGQNVKFDINNNTASLYINLSGYPYTYVKTGLVKTLDIIVNNVNLGNLAYNGIPLYNVYIQDNKLYIQNIYDGSGNIQGASFNVTLTSPIIYESPRKDNTVEEYVDKAGRVLLKRSYNGEVAHDTYYVYDKYSNLSYVIPPLGVDNILSGVPKGQTNQQVLDGLCYIYHYDRLNRLIEKKLPAKGWEHIVYDKVHRPILVQDANMRARYPGANWLFTKYDRFGRVVYNGEVADTRDRKTLQANLDAVVSPTIHESKVTDPNAFVLSGATVHYTKAAFPTQGFDIFSVNYYDNYSFATNSIVVPSTNSLSTALTTAPKSYATGSLVRVLGSQQWITTLTGYTPKGLQAYTRSKNPYLSSDDIEEINPDFIGRALETKTQHTKAGVPLVINDIYTYDSYCNRMLQHTQKINGGAAKLIAWNKYDDLGQLVQKKVGGNNVATYTSSATGLQTVDFRYNIRGWLKSINDIVQDLNASGSTDLFAYKINYNTPTGTFTGVQASALYNGNIADVVWKSKVDNRQRVYAYKYDALNRIIDANLFTNYNPGPGPIYNYKEGPITYDKNGNISTLERIGLRTDNTTVSTIDALTYSYLTYSNQLRAVSDTSDDAGFFNNATGTATDYGYDVNGNMKKDLNKNIGATTAQEIIYNHLNLPVKITFTGTNKYIDYVYDATGTKIKKTVTNGASITATEYNSSFMYEKIGAGTNNLQFFPHPEGYVKKQSGIFSYVYQYKDHLGNTRLTYADTDNSGTIASTEIIEEDNYYPFGMKHKGYNNAVTSNGNSKAQNYKYQEQERQDELGLNWDSFKWRNYDYAIGRFMNIDPLTEKYADWGPYVFSGNRIIDARELEGLEPHLMHQTLKEAARNFSEQYNGYSIQENREISTQFYKTKDGCYSYATPKIFTTGFSDPSQSDDFPTGAVVAGDTHTHGDEIWAAIVIANVTTGNPLTKKEISKLTLKDFGEGPWQYKVSNGDNGPSGTDTQASSHKDIKGPTFEYSFIFTPSGLAYIGKLSKNGKDVIYKVDLELSKTNPSAQDSQLNINNVPSTITPTVLPLEGKTF